MSAVEEICTITAKGQTTIPSAIRRALGVGYGDRIALRGENGIVSVHAAAHTDDDPTLAPFLALLAGDMAARPETLRQLPPALAARIDAATNGMAVDPDAPIEGDVDL